MPASIPSFIFSVLGHCTPLTSYYGQTTHVHIYSPHVILLIHLLLIFQSQDVHLYIIYVFIDSIMEEQWLQPPVTLFSTYGL